MSAVFAGVTVRTAAGLCAPRIDEASRARYITPQAGRALELLGHAIEYLIDEYIHQAKRLSSTDPEVAAILLLMACNREVYYACPVLPTIRERLRSFFGIPALRGPSNQNPAQRSSAAQNNNSPDPLLP